MEDQGMNEGPRDELEDRGMNGGPKDEWGTEG